MLSQRHYINIWLLVFQIKALVLRQHVYMIISCFEINWIYAKYLNWNHKIKMQINKLLYICLIWKNLSLKMEWFNLAHKQILFEWIN